MTAQPCLKVSISSYCTRIMTDLHNNLTWEVCVTGEMKEECGHGSVCMSRFKYQGENNWRGAGSGREWTGRVPGVSRSPLLFSSLSVSQSGSRTASSSISDCEAQLHDSTFLFKCLKKFYLGNCTEEQKPLCSLLSYLLRSLLMVLHN